MSFERENMEDVEYPGTSDSTPSDNFTSHFGELNVNNKDHQGVPRPSSASSSSSTTTSEASGADDNDTMKACLSAWNKLTGGLPEEEVTRALDDAAKSITSQELTKQSFDEAFKESCPLVALAKPLLDNLKRYEPWDALMRDVYDKNVFAMPWSRKIFLIPLITCLPLLRSRDVVERSLEMNIPIPLVYPVPPGLSGVAHSPRTQSCYTVPFSSLRNVIVPGKPFVLSCGTQSSVGNGKSTFLNMCFQTNFEINAEDAFHPNSVDVVLDRPMMPLPYNVIDCHGNIPQAILRLMSRICHIGLVHVMSTDIADNVDEVLELMDALSDVEMILVLLRDMDKRARERSGVPLKKQLSRFKKKVDEWSREHNTIAVHVLEIPKIHTGDQFKDSFHRALKLEFVPRLKELQPRSKIEGFYEDLETQFIDAHAKEVENNILTINLRTTGDQAEKFSERLKLALGEAEKEIGSENFIEAVFPLSRLNIAKEKKNNELLTTSNENESVNEREKRENNIQSEIKNISDKMETQSRKQPSNCIDMFIREVVQNNDIARMDEFSNIIVDFSKYTLTTNTHPSKDDTNIHTTDNLNVARRQRGAPIPIFMDEFFKEALLTSKDDTFRQNIGKFGQSLLRHGRPLEILNGDSLSMDTRFLTDVLACAGSGSLIVCSVLGPQSSHKSTLLNYLFGCGFMVGAGRCTKGLYASLFTTEYEGAENLLVLDTEGLLGIPKKDPVFDKQMTLFSLALSHIVLINVKGEMGTDMKNVLEVTMFGLKRLRVEFPKPKIFFILRDMSDLKKEAQQQAILSVLNDIREVGEKIDFNLAVDEESFILLPTALAPRDQENLFQDHEQGDQAYVERNVTFSKHIKNLKNRLLRDTVAELTQRESSSTPFVNAAQWVTHAKTVWDSVQLFGDMLNFNTLKDYYDRNDLGRIAQEIVKELLEKAFMLEVRGKINQTLSILNNNEGNNHITATTLAEKEDVFINFVDRQLQPQYADKLKETFTNRVKDLRVSEGMKNEYADTLIKALEKMCYTARQEFQFKKGRVYVQIAIQDAILEIRTWIDTKVAKSTATETRAALEPLFDEKWTSTEQQIRTQLTETQPSQDKIDRDLCNDFHTVVKSIPSLNVVTAQLGTERNRASENEMLTSLDPNSSSFRSDWFDIMQKHYITRPLWPLSFWNKKKDVQEYCRLALKRISGLFSSIKLENSEPWNSFKVQTTIISLDNIIRDFDEKHLGACGQNFTPEFYSICHASLFTLLREIIWKQCIQQTKQSLSEFASHEKNLKAAFIRLITERFDDRQTSSSIAAFFMAAISKKVTTTVEDEFLPRLRDRVQMAPQQLINNCEKLQSDDDILLYITDPPTFMSKTFAIHFDKGYDDLMQQIYMGKYQSEVSVEMKILRGELMDWKSLWSESAVKDFLKSAGQQARDQSLAATIYTFFVDYLQGKKPGQINPELFNLLNSKPPKSISSKMDFSYLFAAIPTAHAIKVPALFIVELIKNMDKEMGKEGQQRFNPSRPAVSALQSALLADAIGCRQRCPMCFAKCTESLVGHKTHRTDNHRLTAFAGCHTRGTRDFVFYICTSRDVHSSAWAKGSEAFLPFDEFMAKHHPDWSIAIHNDAEIQHSNKIRWVKVRQELCKRYNLDDNTPKDWFLLADRCCLICMNTFGTNSRCGTKKSIPCGHYIGSLCLAELKGRPEAERKCPQCGRILPR